MVSTNAVVEVPNQLIEVSSSRSSAIAMWLNKFRFTITPPFATNNKWRKSHVSRLDTQNDWWICQECHKLATDTVLSCRNKKKSSERETRVFEMRNCTRFVNDISVVASFPPQHLVYRVLQAEEKKIVDQPVASKMPGKNREIKMRTKNSFSSYSVDVVVVIKSSSVKCQRSFVGRSVDWPRRSFFIHTCAF